MSHNFEKFPLPIDITPLLEQLEAHPELWDEHPERKDWEGSPHAAMSDIWVRFRPKSELIERKHAAEPHIPAWYPSRKALPQVEKIALDLMAYFRAVQLGGVLITKIPPGKCIEPHHDRGRWHPEFFNCKIYIPLQSNEGCLNRCENDAINMKAGEVWSFDNLKVHSVENNGTEDRITLIISMRVEQ